MRSVLFFPPSYIQMRKRNHDIWQDMKGDRQTCRGGTLHTWALRPLMDRLHGQRRRQVRGAQGSGKLAKVLPLSRRMQEAGGAQEEGL